MKIKKISINGFRSLVGFKLRFEDGLTVIVGENDAGKTSLVDCLRVITQNQKVEADDFNFNMDQIAIEIEIDNFIFEKTFTKEGSEVSEGIMKSKPSPVYVEHLKTVFVEDYDHENADNINEIKCVARELGLTVRTNSQLATLKNRIIELLNQGGPLEVEGARFPSFNNIQLDGNQFENVPSFFKEVFLKEKQSSIWSEKVTDNLTVEEFVQSKIEAYSNEVTEKIRNDGILTKLRMFLGEDADMKVTPLYQSRDLSIDAKVQFLEGDKEINISKKGYGTKRRISMALLEYKKEQSIIESDSSTIYLLDEPDTHLHVKAQVELLDTIQGFADAGNQVILTTHSPFVINQIQPKNIRLIENKNNVSRVKFLRDEPEVSNRILRSLGVENTYLFFSRHLVIVEGETEEGFLPEYFITQFDKPIGSNLVKIINTKGIANIPGFCKAILEIHDPEKIYLLFDNDATDELNEVIEALNVPDARRFIVGNKEFEDAFSDKVLFEAWQQYLISSNKNVPETWTEAAISDLRATCMTENGKFSKEIRQLNSGGKKMTKPILGRAIAQRVTPEELPETLSSLIELLK